MAIILPSPHFKHVKMTPGEREFAARLMTKLEDDYTVWFDVPVGRKQLRPDFIILHPGRGILVLEVKDWKLDTLREINHKTVELLTDRGIKHVANPLEQARAYAIEIKEQLERDPFLVEQDNPRYKGKLIFPWGYGVVLTNITRKQLQDSQIDQAIAPDKVICKDEMLGQTRADAFQQRMWDMFHYNYGSVLTMSRIDRIRWHLFPEIRIDQGGLFTDESARESESPETIDAANESAIANALPDIVKVMDYEQEKFARNLGEGHRLIHGVAGSGKTLILAQRAIQLGNTQLPHPILVLCYNKTLAMKLNDLLSSRGAGNNVQVRHFHGWCKEMCAMYQLDLADDGRPVYDRQVEAVINGVDKSRVPRAQYSSILIDEGHDFESDWFKLIVQMLDPATDSLLLVYDDVQSIYKRKKPKSWASVGINVPGGRSKILKLNYRNTAEAIDLAYSFVSDYLDANASTEATPIVNPEQSLRHGTRPVVKGFLSREQELSFIAQRFRELIDSGTSPGSLAVLCRFNNQVEQTCAFFKSENLSAQALDGTHRAPDTICVLTMHSSKGLEFHTVAIPDIGCMPYKKADETDEARVLYVAMTRATENLLLTYHSESKFTERLVAEQVVN